MPERVSELSAVKSLWKALGDCTYGCRHVRGRHTAHTHSAPLPACKPPHRLAGPTTPAFKYLQDGPAENLGFRAEQLMLSSKLPSQTQLLFRLPRLSPSSLLLLTKPGQGKPEPTADTAQLCSVWPGLNLGTSSGLWHGSLFLSPSMSFTCYLPHLSPQ